MMLVIRMLGLAGLVVVLAQCGGDASSGVHGCDQIAQKSEGPCHVGTSPRTNRSDNWRTQ